MRRPDLLVSEDSNMPKVNMLDKLTKRVRGIISYMAKTVKKEVKKEEKKVEAVKGFDPSLPENKQREYR